MLPFGVVEYERRGEKHFFVSCNKNILDLTIVLSLIFSYKSGENWTFMSPWEGFLYFARAYGRVLCYFSPYYICFQLAVSFEFVTTKIFSSVPLADAILSGQNQRIKNVNLFSERISQNI